MHAAVVLAPGHAPSFREFADPVPRDGELLVSVRAAAVTQLSRAQASGKHYSGGHEGGFVPGADGVGTLADGRRVYFALPRAPFGSMAQRTVVPATQVCEVPDALDDVQAAALGNPGMSSYAGLDRAGFASGQCVCIHGATGASGRLAIGIARARGAARIVVTGRTQQSADALLALGADVAIGLDGEEAAFERELARGLDVVLDYLWGAPSRRLIEAIGRSGPRRVCWVQIGSMAGAHVELPAFAVRASGLEILGSGIGSVSNERLVHASAGALKLAAEHGLRLPTHALPLAAIEEAWALQTQERVVVHT